MARFRLDSRRVAVIVLIPLWCVALVAGVLVMNSYQSSPGRAGAPPPRWPAESRIARESGEWKLVMFAHPRCVCTRASLAELDQVMRRLPGRVSATVAFVRPEGVEEGWERHGSWTAASQLRGVSVFVDSAGREMHRFHVATSGDVALYDPRGRLAYSGGITGARGQRGDNLGRQQVLNLVGTRSMERATGNVFGCALAEDPR